MVFGQIPAPPAVGNSSVPLVPGAYRSQKTKKPNHIFIFKSFTCFLNIEVLS